MNDIDIHGTRTSPRIPSTSLLTAYHVMSPTGAIPVTMSGTQVQSWAQSNQNVNPMYNIHPNSSPQTTHTLPYGYTFHHQHHEQQSQMNQLHQHRENSIQCVPVGMQNYSFQVPHIVPSTSSSPSPMNFSHYGGIPFNLSNSHQQSMENEVIPDSKSQSSSPEISGNNEVIEESKKSVEENDQEKSEQ
jgi:hypothetical protein